MRRATAAEEHRIAGEQVQVPADAVFNVEHERARGEEEIEFQLKWSRAKR